MRSIRNTAAVVAAAGLAMNAAAQWSTDPANNLKIADLSGDQVQAKIQPTPDGGCYIAWFDNSSGGYDVYLQRLNAQGVEQWAHNGILLCNRGVSSTVDYDMIVDSAGNALVAYNDDTVEATQQISVSKVDPSGTILWKSTPTTGTVSKNNPHLCQLSKGSYIVGYSNGASPNNWIAQKLDSAGVPQWTAPGITVSEAGHYEALSDLKPSGTGFVAMWVRGSGTSPTTSAKGLYLQKYDAAGAAQWNAGSPVIAFAGVSTASIQNGYFPTMIADGSGGVVLGWYETSSPRNAYLQHVLSGGTLKFAAPISNAVTPTSRIRLGAAAAYNATTGEYYVAATEGTSISTIVDRTFVQKFDNTGNLLWGSTGVEIIPTGSTQQSFIQCQALSDGCVVAGMDTRGSSVRVIFAARAKNDQTVPWNFLVNNDSSTDKSRLASALSTQGGVMLAYGWGNTGSADIATANINADGTLGPPPTNTCYPNCDSSTVPPVLNANDFQCFLNNFAASDPSANCDGSTSVPVLNANDFQCFLNSFAAGCT